MTCEQLKMDLALSAIGALDEPRSAQVRQHVQTCPGCAARLREYEKVCAAQLTAADELKDLPLRAVKKTVAAAARPSLLSQLAGWLMPAAGLGAATAIVLLLLPRSVPPENILPPETNTHSEPSSRRVMAIATLAGYRHALAAQGAASLDSVLERDADVLLQPTPLKELQSLVE